MVWPNFKLFLVVWKFQNDRRRDEEMAKENGMRTVIIYWPFFNRSTRMDLRSNFTLCLYAVAPFSCLNIESFCLTLFMSKWSHQYWTWTRIYVQTHTRARHAQQPYNRKKWKNKSIINSKRYSILYMGAHTRKQFDCIENKTGHSIQSI